eukprot:8806706-Lingulodinium_polyedra.AAC.1
MAQESSRSALARRAPKNAFNPRQTDEPHLVSNVTPSAVCEFWLIRRAVHARKFDVSTSSFDNNHTIGTKCMWQIDANSR